MKYSVILPVYNKADTIIQALDSIYAQTVQDFEIIVVNDGSSDNILEVLSEYSNPITVITQENSGVSVARNVGIKIASGDYICFLDADDLWYPNHLEVLSDLQLAFPDCNYFSTCYRCSNHKGKIVVSNRELASFPNNLLVSDLIGFVNKFGNVINTNSICIKRDILLTENILFQPGEKLGEDVDVWYRIALKYSIGISKEITTLYRREYSTATVATFNPENWCFVRRKKQILCDPRIAEYKKKSYIELCDRYYLTVVREKIYQNRKCEARNYLNKVEKCSGTRYFLTKALFYFPSFIIRVIPSKYKI